MENEENGNERSSNEKDSEQNGTTASTTGTGTEEGSTTDDERWLEVELDLLERMSVRTQTVEEILAEKSDFLLDEEEQWVWNEVDGILPDGCSSSAAAAGTVALFQPMGRYGSLPIELPNSYQLESPLLLQRADSISHQIASVRDRPDGGTATAICVGDELVAVGTSRGLCLLFDQRTQRLVHFVHSGHKSFGSISALDFSPDQSRLAVGFSMGSLVVISSSPGGKVLFRSDDLIQPGRGILHLKYISSHALLIADSGGNVYEFHEKRRNRKKNSVRCLFTGSRGEVVNFLFVRSSQVELLVLTTFHHALLLSLKRAGASVGQIRLHGSSLYPPLVDWRERQTRVTSHTVVHDLRLFFAREGQIRIHQVQQRVGGDLLFPLVRVLGLEQPLLNLKWLDDWTLLGLTLEGDSEGSGGEQLQLIDLYQPESQQRKSSAVKLGKASLVASEDITQRVQLVYNSAEFKGLATGRNVSKAMQSIADKVCLHSVGRCPTEDKVYLLGQNGLFYVKMREQKEQLDALIQREEFAGALLFAIDVFNGPARDRARGKDFYARAFRSIPMLIGRLLEQTIDGLDSGRIDELVAHYKRNIYVLLRSCVSTSHFQLLYDTVYARLQKDCLCRSIFLELMEEFVLEDQLDQPPPALVNDYLSYLLGEGQLPQFEQSVTKLPVECMDLHQVMTACREHQLFDGICHVMNNAMRDYTGPLQEMFDQLQRFVHKEVLSDCEIAQGNKLLLYLSCCLAGRGYPFGELPDEHLVQTVPLETYKFLVQLRPKFSISDDSASADLPSSSSSSSTPKSHSIADLRFPHLNILLKFDAQQFLNVISTCADAPVFANADGRLKRLVDVLIGMCVETEEKGGEDNGELGVQLLAFVTGLLQKGAIERDSLMLGQLIQRVLQQQFSNVRSQKTAEKAVVELLRTVPELPLEPVLDQARALPHVHVCAFIHTLRREFVQLLECSLRDPVDPKSVFPILEDLLGATLPPPPASPDSSANDHDERDQLNELCQFVRHNLGRLCALDADASARLLLGHFPELLVECRAKPMELPPALLISCFQIRREQGHRTLTGSDELQDDKLFDFFFESTIAAADSADPEDSLDLRLADQLRYWLPLGSFSDHCLNLAVQQPEGRLAECSALLLCARGHITRAFQHLFELGVVGKEDGMEFANPNGRLARFVRVMLDLAAAHPEEARAGDWLAKLFRRLLSRVGDSQDVSAELLHTDSLLWRVFIAVIDQPPSPRNGAVAEGSRLAALVGELFAHSALKNAPYRTMQGLIRQILLWSEVRVLMQRSARDCVRHELVQLIAREILGPRPAFSSSLLSNQKKTSAELNDVIPLAGHLCRFCGLRITKSFYLFRCGHIVHLECVESSAKQCPCGGDSQAPAGKGRTDGGIRSSTAHFDEFTGRIASREKYSSEEKLAVNAIFRTLVQRGRLPLHTGPPTAADEAHSAEAGGLHQRGLPPIS